jgi:hypothetical protein
MDPYDSLARQGAGEYRRRFSQIFRRRPVFE